MNIKEKLAEFREKRVAKKAARKAPLLIPCRDCNKEIDIDSTTCPKKVRKLLKLNASTRVGALMILDNLHARCSDCEQKFQKKLKEQKKQP